MKRILISLGMVCLMSLGAESTSFAQAPKQPHAGELAAGIKRLGVVGTVLYVAAHPDDENTRLLAYLVGERGLRAGYLSLTRGDGGQNLIGSEQEVLLGLIRTHELLAARRIDGAEQMFTRARDFGYSKNPEETLRIWGHDEMLSDVVYAFRRFRPDVVITRFNTKPPNHGHHTSSALLAAEAFTAAADPKRFPDQLGRFGAWKADRLLHNTSTWFLPPNADMSGYLKLDVGGFDPLRGKSWGELSAESRSQHKSQGFGVPAERGPLLEYFEPVSGVAPKRDPFEGLDFSWKRFPGTQALVKAIDAAAAGFDPRAPHKSLPALAEVHSQLSSLPASNPYRAQKLREVEALMVECSGLFLEARAKDESAAPGAEVSVELHALNRSPAHVQLTRITLPGAEAHAQSAELAFHKPLKVERTLKLSEDARVTTPYWLRSRPTPGLFTLDEKDRALLGDPEGEPAVTATFELVIANKPITVTRPLVHVWTDPVRGELYRLFEVAPAVTANLQRDVLMFPNGTSQSVTVTLAAGRANATGKVKLELPEGWSADPKDAAFTLANKGDEREVAFRITPPKNATQRGVVRVLTDASGKPESWRVRRIRYDHLPPLTVRDASEAALVPLTLASRGRKIAYIPGAGDRVAESLAGVGYDVTVLPEERLSQESLERFDAIVVGVRAFNTQPRLVLHRDQLLRYVERGGRLVVQYNTNSRVGPLKVSIGPAPLEIGRDRVTDETAAMSPLMKNDPVLTQPNRLTDADFEGWVQERGLYFASSWDEKYRPVFSLNDPGEPAQKGALLVTRYGKGTFVYTGLAFFRQLPAGVPGAYRLFANLLAQ